MELLPLIGGGVAAAVLVFWAGYLIRARLGNLRLQSAERQAGSLAGRAGRDAEAMKRNAVLEGREEALRLKQQLEREMLAGRNTQLAAERAFQEKEAAFNRRVELIEKKDRDLKRLETDLGVRETQVKARNVELDQLLKTE